MKIRKYGGLRQHGNHSVANRFGPSVFGEASNFLCWPVSIPTMPSADSFTSIVCRLPGTPNISQLRSYLQYLIKKPNLAYIIHKISRKGAKAQRISKLTNYAQKIQYLRVNTIQLVIYPLSKLCAPASLRDELFRLVAPICHTTTQPYFPKNHCLSKKILNL